MPTPTDGITNEWTRRKFVRTSTALTALGCVGVAGRPATAEHHHHHGSIERGDTILFQGDSITDAKRDRATADQPNRQQSMGKGYAWLAASSLLVGQPEKRLQIYNRGISGNKVPNLASRWQKDCLDIKPNVLSILIGVNDIWHKRNGKYDGTIESYAEGYHALIKRTKESLPEVKLVICEPFVLRCGAVDDSWFPAFDGYRAAAKQVSDTAGATFVPFQTIFDRALEFAPAEHWAKDGVHPSSAGASLMASAWLNAVGA